MAADEAEQAAPRPDLGIDGRKKTAKALHEIIGRHLDWPRLLELLCDYRQTYGKRVQNYPSV